MNCNFTLKDPIFYQELLRFAQNVDFQNGGKVKNCYLLTGMLKVYLICHGLYTCCCSTLAVHYFAIIFALNKGQKYNTIFCGQKLILVIPAFSAKSRHQFTKLIKIILASSSDQLFKTFKTCCITQIPLGGSGIKGKSLIRI